MTDDEIITRAGRVLDGLDGLCLLEVVDVLAMALHLAAGIVREEARTVPLERPRG